MFEVQCLEKPPQITWSSLILSRSLRRAAYLRVFQPVKINFRPNEVGREPKSVGCLLGCVSQSVSGLSDLHCDNISTCSPPAPTPPDV